MTFQKESDFEEALIKILTTKGWESTILKYPTEQDLIRNWANILFDNNRGIDRLGDYPLTDGEMQQIVEQIRELRTPLKLNGFINGKTVSVKRDNPDDKAHFGKEVSLKIYDRMEIAAGQSRYQIVQQPIFPGKSKMLNDRRGDLMLLINGMPVFHLELKRSGVPVSQAYNQIEKRFLSTDVKKVAKKEISKTFDTTKKNNSISTKQSNMVETIKTAAQKTDNLPVPKKGSNYRKIYDANQLLINGVETVSSSVPQLSTSLKTISGGQAKVGTAIKLLAQKD